MHVDVLEIRHVQEMIAAAREVMSVQITMTDRRLAQEIANVDARLAQALVAEHVRVDERFAEREHAHDADRTGAERAVEAALRTAKEAVDKSESATDKRFSELAISTDKRFDAVNEFRAQLSDQATRFMPREVAEAQSARFVSEIDTLKAQVTTMQAQSAALKNQRDEVRDDSSLRTAMVAGSVGIATLILSVLIVVANYLSSH